MKLPAFAALLRTLSALGSVRSFNHNGANHIQAFSSTGGMKRLPARCRPPPQLSMTIISPFDSSEDAVAKSTATATYTPLPSNDEPLELTWENVDMVLEEMRPYLLQDGGNVAISEIDGPVVRLELQGACGTCPSSTQTMKMGLERKLRERIPEIQEVVQSLPDTPDLNEEQINVVLDTVRPFLQVAGGTIDVRSITGEGGLQPTITLKMEGAARR